MLHSVVSLISSAFFVCKETKNLLNKLIAQFNLKNPTDELQICTRRDSVTDQGIIDPSKKVTCTDCCQTDICNADACGERGAFSIIFTPTIHLFVKINW